MRQITVQINMRTKIGVHSMVKRYLSIGLTVIALIVSLAQAVACNAKSETPPAAENSKIFFTPLTYTSDEYGFAIQYPDIYKEVKTRETGDIFFYAAGPLGNQLPVLYLRKINLQETDQQKIDNIKKSGGFDVSVKYLEAVSLADGKTRGKLYLYVWYFMNTLPMRNLELVVTTSDYAIGATVMATEMMYNKKRYMDILNTFTLK
jgi:hypothetical protein